MNAGISSAVPTANGAASGAPGATAGLFGALAGGQAHGPMAGFEALLAAFFGHQGQGLPPGLATDGAASLQGKTAQALKSDNKAGHPTMDDALNLTPAPGDALDGKSLDDKAADQAADSAAAGLSPDAMALAALFASPAAKPDAVVETTGEATADTAGAKAADAAGAKTAFDPLPPGFDHGLGRKVGLERRADEAADAAAAETAGDAEAKPATEAPGKAKLIELAQQLAGRNAAAAKPAEAQAPPKTYTPPPAPPAEPVLAAQVEVPAEAQPIAAEAEVAAAEAPAPQLPTVGKDRAAGRNGRFEVGRKDGADAPAAVPTDAAAMKPTGTFASFAAKPDHTPNPDAAPAEPEAESRSFKVDAADDAAQAQAAPVTAHATPAAAHAAAASVRGAPETVASLAAQILKKLDARSTRFDVELHPADLGRVDVRLEIGAHGRLTASMSFENPQAAAELRSRADELQRALESAGFDLSGGLSFDVAGDRGQGRNQTQQDMPDGGGALRGRAFEAALATAGESAGAALAGALTAYQGRAAPGLDIRI